jgi:hypothetical protein
MGKLASVSNSFTFGELSPRSYGLFSAEKPVWKNGAGIIENWLIWQTGGALFSPGTAFCVETKVSANKSILRKFRYSITQSYIMEIGDKYFRFVANKGQLVDGSNNPVEVTTPYLIADCPFLQTANKADVMYICNANYSPYKLIRTSATTFTLQPVVFYRGPFRDMNVTNVLLTASSATGATTLTATCPAWGTGTPYIINDYVTQGGQTYKCLVNHTSGVFATDLAAGDWVITSPANTIPMFDVSSPSKHIGSLWLINKGQTTNGVVQITAVTNAYTAVGFVMNEPNGTAGNLGTTSAITNWAEGAFSNFRGWPSAVTFHEGRLVYGGPGQYIYGSVVGAYDNFAVGAANDADAYIYELATDIVTTIRWLASTDKLQIGTSGGTASASGGATGITPTNIQVIFDTDYSVQPIPPETISSYLYYLQSNTYQLRQLVFDLYMNKQKSEDMTLLADHILRDGGGAVDMDRQQSPNDRLWIVRADGQMAVFTRNAEQQVMGFSRRTAGVTALGAGLFESVCTLTQDGDDDIIYVIVNRNVNGVTKRYIEYFTPELFSKYYDPIRLDCSSTLDSPITITAITKASPCVVTAPSHGFSGGEQIKIDNVVGMTDVNTNKYLVVYIGANSFSLTDLQGNAIDSSNFGLYLSGGQVRKMVTAISGLSYLNGEYVTVVSDGGMNPQTQTFLVSAGAITLPTKVAVCHIGLPYKGTLQLLALSTGSQQGTGISKPHRIYDCALVVDKSLGGNIGIDSTHMSRIIYPTQTGNVIAGHAPLPYSGVLKKIPSSGWNNFSNITITQDLPLPLFILAVIVDSEEQDKG